MQQALLKIVEGSVTHVPPQGGRKHPHQELIAVDTSNILFICGGAFEGLDSIIRNRTDVSKVGFGYQGETKGENVAAKVTPEDLVRFGLIPELIGRLAVTASLDQLSLEALVDVLTKPKNALVKQYRELFRLEHVDLSFNESALYEIAKRAKARGTGARGLRSVMEKTLLELMYEVPGNDLSAININLENLDNPQMILAQAERQRTA